MEAFFQSPNVWSDIAHGSMGLGSRRQRVNQKHLLSQSILLLPLEYQARLAEISIRLKTATCGECKAEFQTIVPALLHEIFEKQQSTAKPTSATVIPFEKPSTGKGHDNFREAVLVGAIVKAFAS